MRVVIAGAGSVGSSIARELLSNNHDILLIDPKPEVIGRSGLKGARWLIGDACEITTLREARLEDADVVVSATGDDKVNLVVSLLAKSEFGVGRTVGRVNNPKNDWMFDDSWGVDVAVNTPRLMTALVEEAVEIGDLVRLLTLQTGVASMVEFTVPTDSALIGRRIGSIDWPQDATVVAILRDDIPITPSPDDVVEASDELFFITTIAAEDDLRAALGPGCRRGRRRCGCRGRVRRWPTCRRPLRPARAQPRHRGRRLRRLGPEPPSGARGGPTQLTDS